MLFSFGRVIVEPVTEAGQPAPPELVVTLRDGSRLRGQPSLSAFTIQTGFGEIRVPLDAIVSVRFGEERGKAVACLMNGDRISGTLKLLAVPLKTLLGEVSISLDQITELAVLARDMPADGLVLYYPFDSDKTDVVADRSGNDLHGTVHGQPQFVTGVVGKALQLGDGADWISVPRDNKLDLKGALTLTVWAKYSTIEPGFGSQILWYGDQQPGRDPYLLQLLPNRRCQFRIDAEDPFVVTSKAPLVEGTWYFIAATAEHPPTGGRVLRLYLNGEIKGTLQIDGTIGYDTSEMRLNVGSCDDGRWQKFHGVLDEIRVYNRCLTEAEIHQLFQVAGMNGELQPAPVTP